MALPSMIRIFIPVCAILFLFGGAFVSIWTAAFLTTAKSTNATITSSDQMKSDHGTVLHRPTFVFSASGRDYTVTPRSFVAPSPGNVGDNVPISYNPRNPRRASIDSFVYTWGLSVLLFTFGLALGIIHYALNFAARFIGSLTQEGGKPSNKLKYSETSIGIGSNSVDCTR